MGAVFALVCYSWLCKSRLSDVFEITISAKKGARKKSHRLHRKHWFAQILIANQTNPNISKHISVSVWMRLVRKNHTKKSVGLNLHNHGWAQRNPWRCVTPRKSVRRTEPCMGSLFQSACLWVSLSGSCAPLTAGYANHVFQTFFCRCATTNVRRTYISVERADHQARTTPIGLHNKRCPRMRHMQRLRRRNQWLTAISTDIYPLWGYFC